MAIESRTFTASGIIKTPDGADEVMGLVYKGFTSVTVYSGQDNTGAVILAGGSGPLTILSHSPIRADEGIYVEAAGSGNGSILM